MVEDGATLAEALHKEEGFFYLCGPTWPVPDVYEALVDALVSGGSGFDATTAGDYLEGLKEEERYVLEVYFIPLLSRVSIDVFFTGILIMEHLS